MAKTENYYKEWAEKRANNVARTEARKKATAELEHKTLTLGEKCTQLSPHSTEVAIYEW